MATLEQQCRLAEQWGYEDALDEHAEYGNAFLCGPHPNDNGMAESLADAPRPVRSAYAAGWRKGIGYRGLPQRPGIHARGQGRA